MTARAASLVGRAALSAALIHGQERPPRTVACVARTPASEAEHPGAASRLYANRA